MAAENYERLDTTKKNAIPFIEIFINYNWPRQSHSEQESQIGLIPYLDNASHVNSENKFFRESLHCYHNKHYYCIHKYISSCIY